MYKNLSDIAHLYDNIIFDMWGVLGINSTCKFGFNLYNKFLIQNINKLQNEKFVLSNVVFSRAHVHDIFESHGLDIKMENIFTIPSILENYMPSKNAYVLHFDKLDQVQHDILEPFHNANFENAETIIIPSFNAESVDDMKTIFNKLDLNKKFVCLNADKYSPSKNENIPSSGLIGHWLRIEDADIKILGKPNKDIFDEVLQRTKGSSIMIGDTIYNDILGAHNANIDSALVPTGNNTGKSHNDILSLCAELKCTPPKHFIKLF